MAEFTYFAFELPLVVIGGALFAAQLLAREAGGWARRRLTRSSGGAEEESADKGFLISAMLGLLALLIAFTFSLALNRYEARRSLVIEEANAISTAEMRVNLLPAPQDRALAHLLHDYARTRLAFGLANAAEKPALAHSAELQRDAIQRATISTLRPLASTPLAPFVGGAINSVLDVGVERDAMLSARVPATVLVVLAAYLLLTAAMLGYAMTGAQVRQRAATTILFALFAVAVILILDLDRPQGGSIKTDQTPMARLVASFPPAP